MAGFLSHPAKIKGTLRSETPPTARKTDKPESTVPLTHREEFFSKESMILSQSYDRETS
ncbi:hypothetical protein AA106556_0147 [Neokomagataea tanensis NBRC 106556]|uniref:Transposase n=1 Tax=Neokomagataea tanensis NBRC 106556 TaxID=1223519 RepID=A0ABQ0QG89_9PROT|nr:hypothetical protein AA106556_0147 [Neokomagataea tanensis NBRC 106556]